jgi:hypothetical protein
MRGSLWCIELQWMMIRLMRWLESALHRGRVRNAVRHGLFVVCALLLAVPAVAADAEFRFKNVHRVVVFPDVHGAYEELLSVLRETAVIDESLHWRGGDTHLVSLGDLLDRGPDSRRVLDLLMRLEREAVEAGGAVDLVLGNHEVMNIVGDLRYVSEAEYAAFAGPEDARLRDETWQLVQVQEPDATRAEFDAAFPAGYFAHRQAFSATGRYGAWLLGKPFLITINDMAMVHGGLPEMVARLGLDATNQTLHAELADYLQTWATIEKELSLARPVPFLERPAAVAGQGAAQQSQTVLAMQEAEVFTTKGPTWYRGQALCYPLTEAANLEAALAKLGVLRVVVGHAVSPTGRVLSRFDKRVILLDAGMLKSEYQGSPAAFVLEDGRWAVAYADLPGQRLEPEILPRAVGPRPRGLDDDALEQWLQEAEVVNVEELDTGITNPRRVSLRKDAVELRAVFKQLSTDFAITDRTRVLNESDRFEYELAAYRLDRLLGLNMVPVTVSRTIKGHRGILQFWVDDSINLRKMLEQKLTPAGWCEAAPQYNLMNIFDFLIGNTDRTQENALFTKDWMLVLIDHTRAFSLYQRKPVLLYQGEIYVPPAFAEHLKTLNREKLRNELGRYLHRRQIDALLKRRDLLLNKYGTRPGGGADAAP